jgi:membrane peptidoglycan carboxypeptidase
LVRAGRRLHDLFTNRWLRAVVRLVGLALLCLTTIVTTGVWYLSNAVPLPDDPVAPQASQLFYRDGHTLLAWVGISDREDVSLDRVPLPVREAVLTAEDRDFYSNSGISVRGILRAMWADAQGGSEGASTITQQYARNAYLTQDQTIGRKLKEMVLAIKLEHRYSKDEILDRYLNEIYFGRGAYGIAAAAQAYFGQPIERLTVAQGAVLAAVIRDPTDLDPANDPVAAHDRWTWIVSGMADAGYLTQAAADALVYPDVLAQAPTDITAGGVNGLIVGLVERELDASGITAQTLHTAGLRVITTLDARTQQAALAAIARGRHGLDPGIHAALVAEDPLTGGILAYYGGDRGAGFFDDATAPRPPASTFKPIVLAAGLQQGISYSSTWDGSSPRLFPDRHGVPLRNAENQQCPRCPLDQAMVHSLNTPYFALAERVGAANVRTLAQRLGVSTSYDSHPSLVDSTAGPRPGSTEAGIALGIYPVSPIDLAQVYASFAANGVRASQHVVAAVLGPSGTTAWLTVVPRHATVLDPRVAADVSTVLAEVVSQNRYLVGRPVAGKTGTQQWGDTIQNQDAWMAGYTPSLAVVVWVGRPQPGPIRDATGQPIAGDGRPMTIWRDFLTGALAGQAVQPFPAPAHVGTDLGDARAAAPVAAATNTAPPGPAPSPSPTPAPTTSAPAG